MSADATAETLTQYGAGSIAESGTDPFADDLYPNLEVSIEEMKRRDAELRRFVQECLVENEDYGIIPGTNKPSLWKSGAEKMCLAYGLAKEVSTVSAVEDWDNGLLAYTVKITLRSKRNGSLEAEGVGECNSRERRYKNQDAANIANTLIKMAEKRGMVDATISATRASGVFTQDLEDLKANGALGDIGQPAQTDNAVHTPGFPSYPRTNGNGAAPADNGYQQDYPTGTRPVGQPIHGSSAYINAIRAVEAGHEPECHVCGGPMWNNMPGGPNPKTNPKGPDFKCKNAQCKDAKGYVTSLFPPRER